MKFSLNWLSDFIKTKDFFKEPEKLAERLTQAGLEVESYENQKAQFENVVTAKIESVEKHPQADRLTLCKVSDGSKKYNIICGAKNHKPGDKVVLAKSGAILPEDFKIKKTRIRGIESEGMLASRKELGFESEEQGIWILDKETAVGQNLSDFLNSNDVVFDIFIPPNRSDCLSHKGLAREISCLFDLDFSVKNLSLKGGKLSVKKSLPVEVKDSQACPRYCGRLIEGVTIKESPAWLKDRLKSLGLKSINNVVDITNFVLWDRGQPLHAFDRDKIQSLIIESSKKGEKFLALDESEKILTGEELSIRDKDRILALAGVIGGMDSSITEKTKNIFIESAYFAPEKIRKTARRLGLETDASYRFTRGIDLSAVQEAMDLACVLIQKEAGGVISKDFYDIYNQDTSPREKIQISLENLESRLAYPVKASQFQNWMKRLGCQIKSSKNSFSVVPPLYRLDLNIKEDLIEEFARLEGYDKVPEHLCSLNGQIKNSDPQFLNSQKLITCLSGKAWHQAINYSFCDPEYYKEILNDNLYLEDLIKDSGKSNKKSFSLNNPISQKLSLMKPILVPDLIKNVVSNFRHNNKFGQIFELSPIFYQEKEDYKQDLHLALARWGSPLDIWKKQEPANVYYIKSVLKSVFDTFNLKSWSWKKSEIDFLHPGQSLLLTLRKQVVGFLGTVHPQILQKYKIPVDVAVAEIHWGLIAQSEKRALKFKALAPLSTVEKDLCFVIPPSVSVGEVRKEIKKSLGDLCEKVELFDIYDKKGERSVSFRLYFQPKEKSWTDEELQKFLNQVIETMQKKFSIHLK